MAKQSILVVDDDLNFRNLLVRVLSEAGYEVTSGVNGRDGLRLIAARKFDLVVTDLIMPEKDGTELILELRKKLPRIPIVAMSGGGLMPRGEYLKIAKLFGAHAILEKPFSREQLLAAIETLLPAKPPR